MKLYFKYLSIALRGQMQYKASFFLLCMGQFLVPFTVFAGLYFLFERFGTIRGWSFYEVALCFAVIHIAFSVSEGLARGFDSFSQLVRTGDFDRLLVRPRTAFIQVLGWKFEFTRLGRLIQSVVVFVWALSGLTLQWSILKVITLIMMMASGICIFTGIFVLQATLCFWTVEGLEVANILTDGGREISQYPLNIYKTWIVRFFTYVIPFGCVNYLPLMFLLDKAGGRSLLYMITPLYGILFLIPCLLIWRFGVRHYRSTGS